MKHIKVHIQYSWLIKLFILVLISSNIVIPQNNIADYVDLKPNPFLGYTAPIAIGILKVNGAIELEEQIFNSLKSNQQILKKYLLFPYKTLDEQKNKLLGVSTLDPNDPKVRKALSDKLDINLILFGQLQADSSINIVLMDTKEGSIKFSGFIKNSLNSKLTDDLVMLFAEQKMTNYSLGSKVELDISPVDANVKINNADYTNKRIAFLKYGVNYLSIKKLDYVEVNETITITNSESKVISYLLLKNEATLTFDVSPRSASIFIDGASYPLESSLKVKSGYHKVFLSCPFYESRTDTISIEPQTNNKLTYKLTPLTPEGFVLVEGGDFSMGSNEDESNEAPIHKVFVSSFYLAKHEVTQKKWKEIMGTLPRDNIKDESPVVNVSWKDVQVFIDFLNKNSAKHFRLPTEAEWEYAAKGGKAFNAKSTNQEIYYQFSGSNTIGSVAWSKDYSDNTYHDVGKKRPNDLGLFDMTGNVWEWCSDWYGKEYYQNSPKDNPKGLSTGYDRVLRGGSFRSMNYYSRVTARNYFDPDYKSVDVGFRLACDL